MRRLPGAAPGRRKDHRRGTQRPRHPIGGRIVRPNPVLAVQHTVIHAGHGRPGRRRRLRACARRSGFRQRPFTVTTHARRPLTPGERPRRISVLLEEKEITMASPTKRYGIVAVLEESPEEQQAEGRSLLAHASTIARDALGDTAQVQITGELLSSSTPVPTLVEQSKDA